MFWVGLVHRYLITGRPPVSNLYDTIPFITAGAVVILAIAELLTRRKVLLSLGAALGVIGLFFAASFEVGDAKDNMGSIAGGFGFQLLASDPRRFHHDRLLWGISRLLLVFGPTSTLLWLVSLKIRNPSIDL